MFNPWKDKDNDAILFTIVIYIQTCQRNVDNLLFTQGYESLILKIYSAVKVLMLHDL